MLAGCTIASVQKIKLPVILSQGDDGYIVAEVPVIPGCISQGKTIEEALENIKEAAELCLENREAEGWELPQTLGVEQIEISFVA
jgi:predicted RNase H-like HicB family nuclease